MSKIRLLVDGHWFDYPSESTATFIKGLYTQIIQDDEIQLFIAARDIEKVKGIFHHSPKIIFVPLRSPSKYMRLLFEFPNIIRTYKIDAAHYQYISPLIKTTREIVTIHDLIYRDFEYLFPLWYRVRNNFFFKRSAKRADLVTSVSEYSVQAIHHHFNIPMHKLRLVPNGIESDFFHQPEFIDVKGKYHLSKYILCVSRIEPRKNHLQLVKAYHELGLFHENIQLVLVGRQDIPVPEFDRYLSALPETTRKCIRRIENIDFLELKNLYCQALVSVYPSLAEGFGLPPLEAAALKTQVLCSNATAMADFSFFENALFDPTNLHELKEKLYRAVYTRTGDNGEYIIKCIQEKYNWADISKRFIQDVKLLF